MIATVFLDWGLSFGAGLLFGIAGRGEFAVAPSRVATRPFRWGLAYLHVGVIAISLVLYAMNPDWMWMYWVDPRALPVAVVGAAFALYEVCFLAGFFLATEIDRRRRTLTWVVAAGMFAAIIAAEIATRVRLLHFGTIDEFAAGRAPLGIDLDPFRLEPEMAVVLGAACVATAALGLLVWRLSRMDRRRFGAAAEVSVAAPRYTAS